MSWKEVQWDCIVTPSFIFSVYASFPFRRSNVQSIWPYFWDDVITVVWKAGFHRLFLLLSVTNSSPSLYFNVTCIEPMSDNSKGAIAWLVALDKQNPRRHIYNPNALLLRNALNHIMPEAETVGNLFRGTTTNPLSSITSWVPSTADDPLHGKSNCSREAIPGTPQSTDPEELLYEGGESWELGCGKVNKIIA